MRRKGVRPPQGARRGDRSAPDMVIRVSKSMESFCSGAHGSHLGPQT
jgi:hypothetical protein